MTATVASDARPAADARRLAPLAIAGVGALALVASVPFGPKAAVIGAVLFLAAMLLALIETYSTLWTWQNGMVLLVAVIWLIPIRVYRFPVDLGVGVEPYRVLLIALVTALGIWAATGRGKISAAGAARPLILLSAVAVVTQIANYGELTATTGEETALKALSYFLGFILVFVLVASVCTSVESINTVIRAMVIGAAVVAGLAIYEGRSGYNVFNHLSEWIPVLEKQPREAFEFRGGQLRVHASAQHPIALGVALIMIVPLALYLSEHAKTVGRSRLWMAAAGVVAIGAVSTISRTIVVMLVAMVVVAIWLRGSVVIRFWPLVLILPFVIHFVSPGALGTLYNSFSPRDGLTGELSGRPGQSGSGRISDLNPGLRLWEEEPIVGHGLGSVQSIPTATGSPLEGAPIVFDDQYLNTLVSMGAVGLSALLWLLWGSVVWLARGTGGRSPTADLMAVCCVSATGFAVSLVVFDAFAFVQATLVFFIIAALGLRARMLAGSSEAPLVPVSSP